MIQKTAWFRAVFAILGLAFIAACTEPPTSVPQPVSVFFGKGKGGGSPNDCGFTPLRITFGDNPGDALRSDGGGDYEEATDGGVHLNGPTGRLMLWTAQYGDPTRVVDVSTTEPFSGPTSDRIYTNGHDSECAFKGMAPGSAGSAVLEAELDADGIVRYGKTCDGDPSAGTRVATSRSADGLTWTIDGASGVHCRSNGLRGKKKVLIQVGTAGPFSMTLVDITSP